MRKKFVLLVFCLCIGMVYAQENLQKNPRKIALLIGNSVYEHWGELSKVKDDVTIIKEALEKIEFEIFEGKAHENLSTEKMRALLGRFEGTIRNYGIVLFYYSGHGVELENGEQYLIGKDSKSYDTISKKVKSEIDQKNDEIQSLPPEEKKEEINSFENTKNTIKRRILGIECLSVDRYLNKKIMLEKSDRANIMIIDACRERMKSGGSENGLRSVPSIQGTICLYAAESGKKAPDDGLFAENLAELIQIPEPFPKLLDQLRNRLNIKRAIDFQNKLMNSYELILATKRPKISTVLSEMQRDYEVYQNIHVPKEAKVALWKALYEKYQNKAKTEEEREMLSRVKELMQIEGMYGLPEDVWKNCQYNHNGEKILDMASEYWCRLSVDNQRKYATQYQAGYAKEKGLELEKTVAKGRTIVTEEGWIWKKQVVQEIQENFVFRLIPPGRFYMGSPDTEKVSDSDERPRHRVIISKAFYVGKYEVTKAQWKAVMGESIQPYFKNSPSDAPMESISWDDCQSFCQKTGFQLPTEAQWEYACRSGVYGMSYIGDFEIKGLCNAPGLDAIAWYSGNSEVSYEGGDDSSGWPEKQYDHKRAGTQSVGKKLPNSFGLYDMLGNVWEWCRDKKQEYSGDNIVDPEYQNSSSCLFRGGAWCYDARNPCSGNRGSFSPSFRDSALGFRVFSPAPR